MRRHRKSIWTNVCAAICVSAAGGLLVMSLTTVLFSVLTYFLVRSMAFAKLFTLLSTAAGGFYGGYICGRYRRHRGIAEGMICGLLMFVILSLMGIAIVGEISGIKKLLLLTLFGAAGGVSGVNSKRPQKLMD